jgi:glycosyltransferase involved in cell wall biosynthesis
VSSIGGIPGRVRNTISAAQGRAIQHVCLSVKQDSPASVPETLCAAHDQDAILALLGTCHAADTVVLTPNNTLRGFPSPIREQLSRLPLIHMASGQLSFIIQDSPVLADLDYVDSYRASRILCLSDLDMQFHRQLGIHELTKVKLPVQSRPHNAYSLHENRFVTYVGRIDFHAKGADRLIPIAKLMKERGLPPLQIFTTDGRNSPDLPAFITMLAEAGLTDWIKIQYNETDKQTLYRHASVLLLPSKKEAFGNVILEAFSFGVPVVAPSYAPGPAELIRHGQDGFLLDDFSGESVVSLLERLTSDQLASLSHSCFSRHHEFSMEQYLSSLETIAAETAREFSGQNSVRVFPRLKAILPQDTLLWDELHSARKRIRAIEVSSSWRLTRPLRWIASRLVAR